MSQFKDLFSNHSTDYAKFRPTYPTNLFQYLSSLVDEHEFAWDCGTGNGQAAVMLAPYFKKVIATDPSKKQIAMAEKVSNVEYRICPAEKINLKDQSVSLISVAQAFHWFNQEKFFHEVKRVLKPSGVLAIWCYELAKINPKIDRVVFHLYSEILEDYWEKERQLVEEGYSKVVFPFLEITPPEFEIKATWSLAHFIGYMGTWSAVQTYIKKNGHNPIELIFSELKKVWGDEPLKEVRWNLGIRIGRSY